MVKIYVVWFLKKKYDKYLGIHEECNLCIVSVVQIFQTKTNRSNSYQQATKWKQNIYIVIQVIVS